MKNKNIISSYRDLVVWQKAMDLVDEVYRVTSFYPKNELYCLVQHTRKTSISIPSNIAEGRRSISRKMFLKHLIIAYASGAELETQIEIAKRQKYIKNHFSSNADILLDEVMRMLNVMTRKILK